LTTGSFGDTPSWRWNATPPAETVAARRAADRPLPIFVILLGRLTSIRAPDLLG